VSESLAFFSLASCSPNLFTHIRSRSVIFFSLTHSFLPNHDTISDIETYACSTSLSSNQGRRSRRKVIPEIPQISLTQLCTINRQDSSISESLSNISRRMTGPYSPRIDREINSPFILEVSGSDTTVSQSSSARGRTPAEGCRFPRQSPGL
jgi:hypothetical protein